ncbi:MAG TPA: hypothetical protein VI893_08665, partial [Thermoplasmata archaeon]|nr:hypothetical protein [Thermoplasmata archaeon]
IDLRVDARSSGEPREIYESSLRSFDAGVPKTATILHPSEWRSRDYAVATSSFVFFYDQGPLVNPSEVAAMESMMAELPSGIPVLGWFPTPTKAEENFALQIISKHGKHVIGTGDIPNLSILGGIRPSAPLRHPWWTGQAPKLERDSLYVAFAVPDGDHLGFVQGRMFDLWRNRSQARGLPLGWTLPSALSEIAPGLIEYFYNRSTDDSFIAAPSGAGYAYPDFLPKSEFPRFLARTRHLMSAADLDTLWLLNSFTAYEVPYSERVLSAYAGLRPRGIVLDYADAPGARAEWMQPGGGTGAPVVRAYHLWSTIDNLVEKVHAQVDARNGRTAFAMVTLYPWAHDLSELPLVADRLESIFPGRLRIVSPQALLDLVTEDALVSGREAASNGGALAFLSPAAAASAMDHLAASRAAEVSGDSRLAATEADLSAREMRRAEAEGTLVLLCVAALASLCLVALKRFGGHRSRPKPPEGQGWHDRLPPLVAPLLLSSAVLLFIVSLAFEAQRYFWDYWAIIAALPAALLAVHLEKRLWPRLGPRNTLVAFGTLLVIASVLLTWHTAAFIAVSIGFSGLAGALLEARSNRRDRARAVSPLWLGGSLAVSVASVLALPPGAGMVLLAAGLVTICLIASRRTSLLIPPPVISRRRTSRDRMTTTTAAILAFTLLPVAVVSSGSTALRLALDPTTLAGLAAAATLTLIPMTALFARGLPNVRRLQSILPLLIIAATLLLPLAHGPILLALLAIVVFLATLGAALLIERSPEIDRRSLAMKLTIFVSLGYVLARIPPVSYSLYGTPLPPAFEYAVYAPALIIAAIGCIISLRIAHASLPLRPSAG